MAGHFISMMRSIRRRGIVGTARLAFKKYAGIEKLENQIETLYYVLNHTVDITKFPPADGVLRKLQLCNAALLNIFARICEHNGWQYWLTYGTLLGAVRHKGHIPWDDDIDIAMPRKDFISVREILPGYLKEHNLDCSVPVFEDQGLWFKFNDNVHFDIFPVDIVYSGSDDDAVSIENLMQIFRNWKKNFMPNRNKLTSSEIDTLREKITNVYHDGGRYILPAMDYASFYQPRRNTIPVYKLDDVFPLGTLQFEGYTLAAPNNIHKCLEEIYGNYMSFPSGGIIPNDRTNVPGLSESLDRDMLKLREIEKLFTN